MLNLTNLKYFCDAVKLGGISSAAKANFVTQSAISQGISKLEKTLNLELVAHHPNVFRITPQGEAVYKNALKLLREVIDFKDTFAMDQAQHLGDLEFASTYSFVLAVLPPYLKKFREQNPRLHVNFELGKNHEIKQMLKSGEIDFGILPDENDLADFEKRDLCKGHFKLYVSKKIKPSQQKNLGLILAPSKRKETNIIKKTLKDAYFKKFDRQPEVLMEIGSWEVIVNLVAEGMGMGFFPDYFGKTRMPDLQECTLDMPFPEYTMSAISLKGMKLRKSSEIFLSYFEN